MRSAALRSTSSAKDKGSHQVARKGRAIILICTKEPVSDRLFLFCQIYQRIRIYICPVTFP